MSTATPPGWPRDLPPPAADEFHARVVGWLLDRGPQGLRESAVWRSQPYALAMVVHTHTAQELEGLRKSYSAARRELADFLAVDDVSRVLVALEAAGAESAERARQVALVQEALEGRQWRDRL